MQLCRVAAFLRAELANSCSWIQLFIKKYWINRLIKRKELSGLSSDRVMKYIEGPKDTNGSWNVVWSEQQKQPAEKDRQAQ